MFNYGKDNVGNFFLTITMKKRTIILTHCSRTSPFFFRHSSTKACVHSTALSLVFIMFIR